MNYKMLNKIHDLAEEHSGLFLAFVFILIILSLIFFPNVLFSEVPFLTICCFFLVSTIGISHGSLDNIKGELFVIHGRQDANVDYKQVLELKRKLDAKNIPFDYMITGDEAHGFYGEMNNLELYTLMEEFLARNLN